MQIIGEGEATKFISQVEKTTPANSGDLSLSQVFRMHGSSPAGRFLTGHSLHGKSVGWYPLLEKFRN
jgi:hypothetical protein